MNQHDAKTQARAPRKVSHCRGFAWRRFPDIISCSAARRPNFKIISMVTRYEDVSHAAAAAVVDEDEFKVTTNIQWFQFVRSWMSRPRID